MTKFVRLFFIITLLAFSLEASSYSEYTEAYNAAKKGYTRIIDSNNKQKEIQYLKQLVYYGTKINKNVLKYKIELKRLDKNIKITIPKNIKVKPKVKPKAKSIQKSEIKKSKYSIKSVVQNNNKIIITFNKKISKKYLRYFTKRGKKTFQYIFDIKGRFKDAKPTKLYLSGIDRVKIIQYRFNTLRIVLTNNKKLKPIYIIKNKQIIIKVKKNKTVNKVLPKVLPKKGSNYIRVIKEKTIVIDAGHGGKDSGAVGPSRRYEKTITLNIGKYLFKILKERGYKVYLTRARDKYVSLKYRTKLANKKNADMFISIHANAARKSRKSKAEGVETYFLSPARSAKAKRVAALENKGDMKTMSWSSQSTFLTVLNQGKITASNKMAIDIQKNMLYTLRKQYGKKTIKDGGVREGPFWVLVGAQMPSILIEVGYISHPKESRRIYSSKYQRLISKSIANGIDSYFLKNQ